MAEIPRRPLTNGVRRAILVVLTRVRAGNGGAPVLLRYWKRLARKPAPRGRGIRHLKGRVQGDRNDGIHLCDDGTAG